MKTSFYLLGFPVLILAVLSGCAQRPGYFADRGRDAADIFTATAGYGLGAKAELGPLQIGLIGDRDLWGLRGGAVDSFDKTENWEASVVFTTVLHFSPENPSVEERGKELCLGSVGPILVEQASSKGSENDGSYYTQIEVAAGAGLNLRLGVNPGEMLDFALGWFGVDIYGADIRTIHTIQIPNAPESDRATIH